MDFFAEQDVARKRSGRLVLLFLAAVLTIMISIYAVAMIAYNIALQEELRQVIWWHPGIFAATIGGLALIIFLGSLGRIASLSSGGPAVAEMVGGTLINSNTRDAAERRVLNVVEEMALASGTPVPPVYLLDEEGINAFAAGYRLDNAVIGVTRGAVERLSRDELQGVIAHEFSHILNGDMRLNIRLMGVLYGILMISILGSIMMRALYFSGGRRRSSSSKDNSQAIILGIAAAGLAMYILGYLGVFFGNLIKAAVSRQREFLADASAVQYTRNPDGIGGALKKLAGFHTKVANPRAKEASHLFFGPISSFSNLLSTHPPLEERIRRLDPAFIAEQQAVSAGGSGKAGDSRMSGFAAGGGGGAEGMSAESPASGAAAAAARPKLSREQVLSSIGDPQAAHMAYGRSFLAAIPEVLAEAIHEPFSARAVVECLLLDDDEQEARSQLQALESQADPLVWAEIRRVQPLVRQLPSHSHIELVELCLPALSQMTKDQRQHFFKMVDLLITHDQQVTAFEYALRHLIRQSLDPSWSRSAPGRPSSEDVRRLLMAVAAVGAPDDEQAAAAAYLAATKEFGLRAAAGDYQASRACDWKALDASLLRLGRSRPLEKKKLIHAALHAVAADGVVSADEGDILRVIAISLDCPVPPLVVSEQAA